MVSFWVYVSGQRNNYTKRKKNRKIHDRVRATRVFVSLTKTDWTIAKINVFKHLVPADVKKKIKTARVNDLRCRTSGRSQCTVFLSLWEKINNFFFFFNIRTAYGTIGYLCVSYETHLICYERKRETEVVWFAGNKYIRTRYYYLLREKIFWL